MSERAVIVDESEWGRVLREARKIVRDERESPERRARAERLVADMTRGSGVQAMHTYEPIGERRSHGAGSADYESIENG